MEDNDDDYEPDSSGYLELRYRGWTDAHPRIWSFAHCLLNLDISFNQLHTIPPEISNLSLLQELNCACNKLQYLPGSIASMSWLRVIKANGNGISIVPKEIGQCKALELLNLSENILTSLPPEIAGCSSLAKLLLQNNDLPRLPLSMSTLTGQIQDLDISNNSHEMVTTMPIEIHRDVHSIMWILSLQQEKRHCIDRLKQDNKGLQHDNVATEEDLAKSKERIATLQEKKRVLESEMESIEYFLLLRSHCRDFRRRSLKGLQEWKSAWAQKT